MFGFTYEDSDVELYAIQKYLGNDMKGKKSIMILSGGDTMFDLASSINNFDDDCIAVDINPDQLKIVNEKLLLIGQSRQILEHEPQKLEQYKTYLENLNTSFDELFKGVNNSGFDSESFNTFFSTENLIQKFGPNAVTNTSENFAVHFMEVFNMSRTNITNTNDWIFSRDMNYKVEKSKKFNLESISKIKLVCDNIINLLEPNMYDFIQVSNLGDWMCHQDFIFFCERIKLSLKQNGICVIRRLLSDNYLSLHFPKCEIITDKTNFYKETIIWIKQNC